MRKFSFNILSILEMSTNQSFRKVFLHFPKISAELSRSFYSLFKFFSNLIFKYFPNVIKFISKYLQNFQIFFLIFLKFHLTSLSSNNFFLIILLTYNFKRIFLVFQIFHQKFLNRVKFLKPSSKFGNISQVYLFLF